MLKKLLIIVLCIAAIFMTACAKTQPVREKTVDNAQNAKPTEPTPEPKQLIKLKLNEVTRSVFYAPLYAAVQKGFFADEGIELTIETGGGSDKSMTALLAGDADVALMGPETVVYVVNQGKKDSPVVIGQLTKRDGSFLISREDEADSFTWESLKGKTIIGGRRGGMPLMTLEYVLRQHGLEPGVDVTVIDDVQFNLMAGAFEGGQGDYVTLFEPTATNVQNAGKGYIVANVGLESGEVPYTAFMMTRKMLDEKPDIAESFLRAVYKAQQWVDKATDKEIAEAIAPFFPDTDAESLIIVAHSYRETDSWMKTPVMTKDSYNRLLDIVEGAGELTKRPAMSKVVDNSFAEKVVGQ